MIYKPSHGVLSAGGWRTHPLAKNLTGLWAMNEGGGVKIYDALGSARTGTLISMSSPPTATSGWWGGFFGTGLQFDGTNDYIDMGTSVAQLIMGRSEFSVSFWTSIRSQDGIGGDPRQGMITLAQAGPFPFGLRYASGFGAYIDGVNLLSASPAIPLNTPTHVAFTMSSGGGALFLNGVKAATATAGTPSNNSDSCFFGQDYTADSGRNLNGLIDMVMFFSKALTVSEVGVLYSAVFPFYPLQQRASVFVSAGGGQSVPSKMRYYRNRRVA